MKMRQPDNFTAMTLKMKQELAPGNFCGILKTFNNKRDFKVSLFLFRKLKFSLLGDI